MYIGGAEAQNALEFWGSIADCLEDEDAVVEVTGMVTCPEVILVSYVPEHTWQA